MISAKSLNDIYGFRASVAKSVKLESKYFSHIFSPMCVFLPGFLLPSCSSCWFHVTYPATLIQHGRVVPRPWSERNRSAQIPEGRSRKEVCLNETTFINDSASIINHPAGFDFIKKFHQTGSVTRG